MTHRTHIPVLLEPVVRLLDPRPGDVVLDCTAGLGGHAAALAARVGPTGRVILMDLDQGNLTLATKAVEATGTPVLAWHASFAEAPRRMAAAGLQANVVLADLGFASPQVDDPDRGFSFMREGPLDMRLNPLAPIQASELVNTMPERDLAELIRDLGEEPPQVARAIAAKVVQERASSPILTTSRLVAIVRAAVGSRAQASSIHPATKTFQALRIAVNDEIGSLERLLDGVGRAAAMQTNSWLAQGARLGIISFHSLEDRPVKQKFSDLSDRGLVQECTRKPVVADEEETRVNPRSRSAKLRVIELVRAI